MGSAASTSGAQAAGARRPLARDICPGSHPGRERARRGGQAPRPGAAGARARGCGFPGYCAPADFHGRLPRSRWRRPGAGLSPGFKRHSRNVNNPGGSAPGQPAMPPTPSQGTARRRGRLTLPLYLQQTFSSSASLPISPLWRGTERVPLSGRGPRVSRTRCGTPEAWRPGHSLGVRSPGCVCLGAASFLGRQCRSNRGPRAHSPSSLPPFLPPSAPPPHSLPLSPFSSPLTAFPMP